MLQMDHGDVTVTRSVNHPGEVLIEGASSSWPLQGEEQDEGLAYSVKEWNCLLGDLIFGLGTAGPGKKYQPTFRSLISYFIRRGKDAFSTPFKPTESKLSGISRSITRYRAFMGRCRRYPNPQRPQEGTGGVQEGS